ncbi:SigB/SigF/SigG family RNA polymerase sigma factor [Dactylosporangium sp. NPDC051541]|uniref:SigB/SigF/SigG family RNA polymerase sigma factor n=1 Tax=Dactylosporangium sp. NPDC051541 TaxID=3363977 RepID=UPI00379503AE
MELSVRQSLDGERCLLELSGVVDYASAPYLRQLVFRELDAGAREVVLEVARLRLLDAAAIRVMLYLRRRAEQHGACVRIAGTGGAVLAALEIVGAAKRLSAYDEFRWPPERLQREVVELAGLPAMPGQFPAEVTELVRRFRELAEGDPARKRARNDVIEVCLPAARRLARRYGPPEARGDLMQVAALGLVKAVDHFDPEHGVDFGAYATPTILGELKRYFRDRTSGVRVPRRLQDLRLRLNRAREELTQTLRRPPSVAELAAHLGVPPRDVLEVYGAGAVFRPLSLEEPAMSGEPQVTVGETVGAYAPEYELVEHHEALRRLIARLPVREQRILALRFYGNQTQAEIAQVVGLSQMHVSRLLAHALDFLRRHLNA